LAAHDVPDSPAAPAAGTPGKRVILHVGEPKTGTTFLQQVMWRNRAELAAAGVVLPGHHPQDHYRASQDLRGIQKLASDPAGSWTGEWDILAQQARQAPGTAVISHELFAAVDAGQAARAVASLAPAQVHVVLTVRDMGTLLPAEWQETVKHRNARPWLDWLSAVIDTESVDPGRRQWWFWRVHDTMAILDLWSRHVPAEQVHVIMTPPREATSGLLWERFAGLLGVDPGSVDLSRARPNSSLGLPEIEFLRRLNEVLPAEVPDWFYMWNVKEAVAHRALAARPREGRLVLPAAREAWAREHADKLVAALLGSGYDLIGEPAELIPRPAALSAGPEAAGAGREAAVPGGTAPDGAEPGGAWPAGPQDQPADKILDAAVHAAAALVVNQYHRAHPAARPQRGPASQRGLVSRVESTVAASPWLKRTVRELSSRFLAVRRLRILAWKTMERRRAQHRA
jgi:hypothetical protein